jgi:hypothetical protein
MYQTFRPTILTKSAIPGIVKEWTFDFNGILASTRKVRGKFHVPKVDKDMEFIKSEAIENAVPDFMHLPVLHDFHKERTVGIVTRVVALSDGSFDFEGLIKATEDCNDVWGLIEAGNYDSVSIYGKRQECSDSCKVRPEQRVEPCVTTGVRLDSISVCDDNARNDGARLEVAKSGKLVFEVTEELIKAETTGSPMMHTATDNPDKKGYRINSKGEVIRTDTKCRATCPQYERPELGKGEDMNDDVDKGKIEMPGRGIPKKGKFDSMGRNYKPPAKEEKKAVDETGLEAQLAKLVDIVESLVQDDVQEEQKGADPYQNYSEKSPELPASEPNLGEELGQEEEDKVADIDGDKEVDELAAKIHLTKKVGESKGNAGTEEKAGNYKFNLKTGPRTAVKDPAAAKKRAEDFGGLETRYATPEEKQGIADRDKGLAAQEEKKKTAREGVTHDYEAPGHPDNPRSNAHVEPSSQKEPNKKTFAPPPTDTHEQSRYDRKPGASTIAERPHRSEEEEPKPAPKVDFEREVPSRIKENKPKVNPTASNVTGKPKTAGEAVSHYEPDEQEPKQGEYGNVEEEKAGGSPLEQLIMRLTEAISKLTQTDAKVHSELEQEESQEGSMPEPQEEEKAKEKEDSSEMKKGTETMKDEEVNTLVKAQVDAKVTEITKAYQGQVDELKKANDELKARLDKMETEVIQKSGVAVVLREGDETLGTVFTSNAAAIAAAGKKGA